MILEMVFRGALLHDVAARVAIRERSRYEEPVTIPSEKEVMALLTAADRLANSKNPQVRRSWERYRPILYLAQDYRGDVWLLTERDAGTRIDGSRNDLFVFRLEEHSGGGYLWNIDQLKASGFESFAMNSRLRTARASWAQ